MRRKDDVELEEVRDYGLMRPPHTGAPKAVLRSLLNDVLIEKANHLARSVRAFGIHVRATRAPAKPRVTAFMHQPVFENNASRRIAVNGASSRSISPALERFFNLRQRRL